MSDKNTGGSATELTLRDYFAAKAMAAYIETGEEGAERTSRWAYGIADAMLAEREK